MPRAADCCCGHGNAYTTYQRPYERRASVTHRRHVRLLFLLRRGRALKPRCITTLVLVQPGDVVEAWDVDSSRQSCGTTWHVTSLIPIVGRKLVLRREGFVLDSPLIIQRSFEYLLLLSLRQQLVLGEVQRHWLARLGSGGTTVAFLSLHEGEEAGGSICWTNQEGERARTDRNN